MDSPPPAPCLLPAEPSSADAARLFDALWSRIGRASVGVRSERAGAPLRVTVDFNGAYLPREVEEAAGYGAVSLAESVEVGRVEVERMGKVELVLFREGATMRALVLRIAERLAARGVNAAAG